MNETAISAGVSGGADGGVPLRYAYTARGTGVLSPWSENIKKFSIRQIALGINPISQLEVVSTLNILNQGFVSLMWNSDRTVKYNPKIYLSTTPQTIAENWIMDSNYASTTNPNHDESRTQKPVAIFAKTKICCSKNLIIYLNFFFILSVLIGQIIINMVKLYFLKYILLHL